MEFTGERRTVSHGLSGVVTVHEPLSPTKGQVIIVPGWSGPRSGPADILSFLASELAHNSWRAVRVDLPGRGDNDGSMSSSGLDEMIASTFAAALATIEAGKPTVFLGLCSGGNVSLGAVTLRRREAGAPASKGDALADAGVIALSTLPFQPARSENFESTRRWKNIRQYAAKAASPQTWLRLVKGEINLGRVKQNVTTTEKPRSGERNLKDSSRNIERELLGWKGSALFVYGGGDEEAPLAREHYEKLHKAGMGRAGATTFQTIAGANHNYYGRGWRRELAELVLKFVEQTAVK
jgi:pimeloyl-ACP methyl ester carboxylesterase